MKGPRLLCLLAGLVPARGFTSFAHRSCRQSVSLLGERAGVSGSQQSELQATQRVVKVMLPSTSVAARTKRKRKRSDSVQVVTGAPAQAAAQKAAEREQRRKETTVKRMTAGSPTAMMSHTLDGIKGNFWLGTFAPIVGAGYATKFLFKKAKSLVAARQQSLVTNYAFEMLKYDGNLATLKEVQKEYQQKGIRKGRMQDKAVLEYLSRFFARGGGVVSGAAIKSLAMVIALNKLDDVKAAALLVAFAKANKSKPVTLGKIVFFAERILKDKAALQQFRRVRATAVALYRGSPEDNELYFEAAQQSLAFGALKEHMNHLPDEVADLDGARNACLAEGKLLGISEEAATREFESMLSTQIAEVQAEEDKYTAKAGEDAAIDSYDDDEEGEVDIAAMIRKEALEGGGGGVDSSSSTSSGKKLIVECTKCENTMFIAAGRESKFFGDDFKCPNCGAPKSDQNVRDQEEE